MAKVRVYELARELDMDSKSLVNKLIAGGLDVKNYMSTLDESSVVKAREVVLDAVSEVVVEKRIKPTVIRRRKKVVKVEQAPPEVVAKEELAPEKVPEIEERPPAEAAAEAEVKPEAATPPPAALTEEKEVPVSEEPPLVEPEPEKAEPAVPEEEVVKPDKQAKSKLKKGEKEKGGTAGQDYHAAGRRAPEGYSGQAG